jgi:N-acyl-D-amino-acid deacylase
MSLHSRTLLQALCTAAALCTALGAQAAAPARYDVVIRNATIYDGSGAPPRRGEVAIAGDRIAYVGPKAPHAAREVVDAQGRAVAPGFVNMLAHSKASLFVDGRALSNLKQGVTLEVFGEGSMGPLNAKMREQMLARQYDVKFDVTWHTLGEYMETLEKRGITPNVATFVGAGTVRDHVLGERDVQPTPAELDAMRGLVRQAMEEGALGVTTMLIYAPETYAKTDELVALAAEAARCGGLYSAHIRSESDRFLEAIDETIEIAKRSGAPAEIYHLKAAGRRNWPKMEQAIAKIEQARASGTRVTADMYLYTAGATGLDAAMPPWVQDGGLEAWVERLKDPAIRARVIAEMRDPNVGWENLYGHAGPEGTRLLGFRTEKLKPLIGRTLADVAKERGRSPEDTAIDLVIEDGTRVDVAYFLMSEDNVRRQLRLPWMTYGSDADAPAPEGVFLKSSRHPRTYGNFARLLGRYVRDEQLMPLQEAVRKLTSAPASVLALQDRGRLAPGYYADVVIFDPATVRDLATFDAPHQLATGVLDVWVNGVRALEDGKATGAASGRYVRGRAWTGAPGGGCRASANDWQWNP